MRLIAKSWMTRRSGFTPVELLAVIVSILIALLVPALAAAMDGR